MRKHYDLDANMHQMLATLQAPREEEDAQTYGEEEEPATIHVYPVAGGGILFSKVPLDQEQPIIIESQEAPDTAIPRTKHTNTPGKEPFFFFSFLLILGFFLLFDMVDSQITALLIPTITVTITPKAHTISTTGVFPLGTAGSANGLQGRVLPTFTLTQSASTTATGHGHQDAKHATGRLTLYNGLFTAQWLPSGTVFAGQHGVHVATSQSVTIPSGNPPSYGQATVSAYAVQAGSAGNIQAGDINTTIANGVLVTNSPFTGGQDARDFLSVTKADIQRVVDRLSPDLLQSEQTALTAQLTGGEALAPPTCSPATTADHGPGSEATTVQVSVSASCIAIAYNQQAIQVKASQLLTSIATQQLGTGYHLIGSIQVTVKQATVSTHPPLVVLSFMCGGTWVYTLSPQEQQHIKHLIAGRTKQQALQLLLSQSGIDKATITGIGENEQVPEDVTHIHLLIMAEE